MHFPLKKTTAQTLCQAKMDDAVLLLKNSRHANAYYLGRISRIGNQGNYFVAISC